MDALEVVVRTVPLHVPTLVRQDAKDVPDVELNVIINV